jgi:hypothetical protein
MKTLPLKIGTRGEYILPAIPPYCAEVRIPATLVAVRDNGRVLLKDDGMPNYFVDTTADAFVPHSIQ